MALHVKLMREFAAAFTTSVALFSSVNDDVTYQTALVSELLPADVALMDLEVGMDH